MRKSANGIAGKRSMVIRYENQLQCDGDVGCECVKQE